jgi:hypothetical protein
MRLQIGIVDALVRWEHGIEVTPTQPNPVSRLHREGELLRPEYSNKLPQLQNLCQEPDWHLAVILVSKMCHESFTRLRLGCTNDVLCVWAPHGVDTRNQSEPLWDEAQRRFEAKVGLDAARALRALLQTV